MEILSIERKTLSDGSHVYNLTAKLVRVGAVSEKDAQELAMKIQHAIHDHTTESASIEYHY